MSTVWYDEKTRCNYSVLPFTSPKGHDLWIVWGERERAGIDSSSSRAEMEAVAERLNDAAHNTGIRKDEQ